MFNIFSQFFLFLFKQVLSLKCIYMSDINPGTDLSWRKLKALLYPFSLEGALLALFATISATKFSIC